MDGWIKLHRRILEHPMLKKDPTARHLFTDLLLLANPTTHRLYAGRAYLSEITGLNPSTVYKALSRLSSNGMLEQQSNNKGTAILICNYSKWQQQSNSKVTLLKNKEEKNTKYIYSPQSKSLWIKLWKHVRLNYPYKAEKTPDQHRANCADIEKIHRLDGHPYALIGQVIDWTQSDSFWRQNIQSGSKLREKFQTILDRMVEQRKKELDKKGVHS